MTVPTRLIESGYILKLFSSFAISGSRCKIHNSLLVGHAALVISSQTSSCDTHDMILPLTSKTLRRSAYVDWHGCSRSSSLLNTAAQNHSGSTGRFSSSSIAIPLLSTAYVPFHGPFTPSTLRRKALLTPVTLPDPLRSAPCAIPTFYWHFGSYAASASIISARIPFLNNATSFAAWRNLQMTPTEAGCGRLSQSAAVVAGRGYDDRRTRCIRLGRPNNGNLHGANWLSWGLLDWSWLGWSRPNRSGLIGNGNWFMPASRLGKKAFIRTRLKDFLTEVDQFILLCK